MMLETSVAQRVRLAAAYADALLWRNNVGVAKTDDGRPVRYGLANESKAENQRIKASDLIGVTRLVITPEHVGRTLGVFTAVETKRSGWTLTPGDKHGQAQLAYINAVLAYGGYAGFATCEADFMRIIGRAL